MAAAGHQVLLVDDDAKLLRVLTLRLEAEGYRVIAAASGEDALRRLEESRPQMVLTDLRMPGIDGLELMLRIQRRDPSLPVAILSAHGDIPEAVRMTQAGAVDFLTKPVDRDRLIECLQRHLRGAPGQSALGWAQGIVTRNPQMIELLQDARRVARGEASVLITGASGTGKEVLARALHAGSPRRDGPFVAIHCAALPAELLEAEWFGYPRDALHGGHADPPGLLPSAHGGTLFLDGIGDLPGGLQARLLRVLQEREIRSAGDARRIPVDVRVISATPGDLDARVAEGRFREDLFYRLNGVRLRLPSLQQRREDIPLLVAHRLDQLHRAGAPRHQFSAESLDLLAASPWPGNLRQLFNVVEQCVALTPGRTIGAALVRKCLGQDSVLLTSLDDARDEFTRGYLRKLLEMSGCNISRAARLAGRNRTDFYKLLNRYGVDVAGFKALRDAD